MNDYRVLIIDDQSLVHDSLKKNLTNLGFNRIYSATSAHYAVRLCETITFDFIFLSFNVSSDKDGFHLYEELKFCGHITAKTTVIFLSADTSQDLVNSIVELEPDDFWAKPLDTRTIISRIEFLINSRKRLNKLFSFIDKQQYAAAIYTAERNLNMPELEEYYPKIKRIIGTSLFKLHQFDDAERYYRKLLKNHNYSWLHIELCRSLLKLKREQEAELMLGDLFLRDDTRFAAYDLITSYCIDNERFTEAYNYIKRATLLAPRNINRNKKLWDLARLNHDRMGQYKATINIFKYAKNSIHDSPHLKLNVIRSAIDLASASHKSETGLLLKNANLMLNQLEKSNYDNEINSQLIVVKARMASLLQNKNLADQLLTQLYDDSVHDLLEDNLDKMKAFHEVGNRERTTRILALVKKQIAGDNLSSKVIDKYLEQESIERTEINFTPKELKEMAEVNYKNNRFKPAFMNLSQAFVLAPNNIAIALSLLKVLVKIAVHEPIDETQEDIINKIKVLANDSELSADNVALYNQYLISLKRHPEQKEYSDSIAPSGLPDNTK